MMRDELRMGGEGFEVRDERYNYGEYVDRI